MSIQDIVFTGIPNGATAAGDRLKLSVFISPRLKPSIGQTLHPEFPDFEDWPSTLSRIKFFIQFEGYPRGPVPAIVVSNPDSSLWKQIFPPTTFVQPYAFDSYRNLNILSYPVNEVVSFLRNQYLDIAESSPENFPSLSTLRDDFGKKIGFWRPLEEKENLEELAVGEITKFLWVTRESLGRGAVCSQSPDYQSSKQKLQMDFEQVKLFYQPFTSDFTTQLQVPSIDFHETVSTLGEYPELMRRLGLVIDLEVPLTEVELQKIPPDGRLRLVPQALDGSPVRNALQSPGKQPAIRPSTQYQLDSTSIPQVFTATPRREGDLGNGMLLLGCDKYDVVPVDVDGAAIKAMDFANNLLRLSYGPNVTTDTPGSLSLPSLRSGGISVTRRDRAYALAVALSNAEQTNDAAVTTGDATLFADDLVRGYRIDVWDAQSNSWHSLCKRVGTYILNSNQNLKIPEDEGWISSGVTQSPNDPNADLHLHESLLRWQGWSLCAPRPRQTKQVGKRDALEEYDSQDALEQSNYQWARRQPPIHIPLAVSFEVRSGSLPRLRFGNRYRLRARAVDLAGNSLACDDPAIADVLSSHPWLTDEIVYARFEPVPAPTAVLRRGLNPSPAEPSACQDSPGESLDRLVIRSNYDTSAEAYNATISRQFNKNFLDFSDRLIAPPKTSQLMAETHGMFDNRKTHKFDINTMPHKEIADRDSWNFALFKNTSTGMSYPIQLQNGDDRDVHYLPDPISRGAALLFIDVDGKPLKTHNNPIKVPFYPQGKAWPHLRQFLFKIQEGRSFRVEYSQPDAGGDLLVELPKAEVVKVRLSSYLGDEDLPPSPQPQLMGILHWASQDSPSPLDNLQELASKGQFWMVTPYREITLVHAVQQPKPPSFERLTASKESGKTYATLEGSIEFHGRSTAKLDVLAAWEDAVDDTGKNLPNDGKHYDGKRADHPLSRSAHVFELTQLEPSRERIGFSNLNTQPPLAQRHEFGDTKYRSVRYTVVATTRFLEYLPDETWKDTNRSPTVPILDRNGLPEKIVRYADDRVDNSQWTARLDILNSARPAKPKVLYVIPTFLWNRDRSGLPEPTVRYTGDRVDKRKGLISRRLGGGLRVYMDRPWYSSGAGELLGVILWRGEDVLPPEKENLRPLVSQWGMDPMWRTNPIQPLSLSNFKNRSSSAEPAEVSLSELDTVNVTVVPYDVAFDTERKLWYSDIEVNPGGTYCPFIRLALVRYQPKSVEKAEISPVVLADFAQLTPNRTVSIVQKGKRDERTLHVSLSGIFPQDYAGMGISRAVFPPTCVQMILQRREAGIGDEDLGWTDDASAWLTPVTAPVDRFEGDIKLPVPPDSREANFRLLILEYERFASDVSETRDTMIQPELGLRLVYAEAVRIDSAIFVSQIRENGSKL